MISSSLDINPTTQLRQPWLSNMTNKILVTGGEGFIGTYVCKTLIDLYSYENVLSIDCRSTYLDLIPQPELNYLISERKQYCELKSINCDINADRIKRIISDFNPTHIIHLAAFPRAKVVDKNPQYASYTLISGLLNVLEQCKLPSVEHFIYISSSMVYGDFDHPIKETEACNPKGIYGILKLTGEQLVKDWAQKNKKQYTILRPSAVYGPMDVNDRVISKFFEAAFNDQELNVHGAEQLLDFTYVEDLATGICSTLENDWSFGHTFNMSRGSSRTLLEAAECIIKLVGTGKINVQEKHPMYPSRDSLDCSAANRWLNFNPTTNIEKGFDHYYEWLIKRPVLRN
jgi:nucleoside-diphosphate-sugar epimerase